MELKQTKEVVVLESLEASIPVIDLEIKEMTKAYTDEELSLLAHLLNGEAGADWCSDEMVYLVGCVALNRVNSPEFPDTLEGVIHQKGQYACVKDGNFQKQPTERCYEIARELLTHGHDIPADVVFQAQFKQGSGVYKKVQNMYFCNR